MYLLDTNVVSELRRVRPHGAVLAWLDSVEDKDLHISAVTIGEIQSGIELTRQQDPRKADEIGAWLDRLASAFDIVPMDGPTFRRWAVLMQSHPVHDFEDAMIAATAIVNNFTVVTRNTKDFKPFHVEVLDPFVRR